MKRTTIALLCGAVAAWALLFLTPALSKGADVASTTNQIAPVANQVTPVAHRHYYGRDWDGYGRYEDYAPRRYYRPYHGDWYYDRPYRYYGPSYYRDYYYYPRGSVHVGPMWFSW